MTKSFPKIYIFINEVWKNGSVIPIAIAEDGTPLASHLCSNESFAKHDMGIGSDWKHDAYRKHYPNGYDLIWCKFEDVPEHIIELARAKGKASTVEVSA